MSLQVAQVLDPAQNGWMLRASDQLRERTVTQLGDGYAQGMLGFDTLCRRVDRAYAARSTDQLLALVRDLPASSGSAIRGLWDLVVSFAEDQRAVNAPALLTPPVSERARRYLVGRDVGCDLRIDVDTVSRRHAALERTGEKWTIEDLNSFNGTFVNGWRVNTPTAVEPGDAIQLADLSWVFAPRV